MQFAASQPDATIFHHPAWSQLLSQCYGYKVFALVRINGSGQIVAGIPIMETTTISGRHRHISLPFSDYCHPLCTDSKYFHPLINDLEALFRSNGRHTFEVRTPLDPQSCPHLHQSVQHVLHMLPLSTNTAETQRGFSRMHRRNTKKARSSGVSIRMGNGPEEIRTFYQLHLQTRRRQGVPVQPWNYFKRLGENLLAHDLGYIMLAYHQHTCLAAALFLHWQQTLTYKYGASIEQGLALRPNNLIFAEAIDWGGRNGFTWLDMGKTDNANTGLRAFKSGWGAEEHPLPYSVFSDTPPREPSKRLQSLAHAVIRASPQWVCRATGELLYKYAS